MATYTAGDQINRALRMLGVLAEGEIPSASVSADALIALNQMLDSWSTENLSIYSSTDQSYVWPAGQVTRTLGPTGDFVGFRPVSLDDSTYFVLNGVSYPIEMISDEQYNNIAVKATSSTIPSVMNVMMTNPNMSMTLWPIPSAPITFHFFSNILLTQPAALATVLSFPPGYLKAFAYNLALEIAPEFGVDPAKDVRRNAMISKRNIKRINSPIDTLQMPMGLVTRSGQSNIITG